MSQGHRSPKTGTPIHVVMGRHTMVIGWHRVAWHQTQNHRYNKLFLSRYESTGSLLSSAAQSPSLSPYRALAVYGCRIARLPDWGPLILRLCQSWLTLTTVYRSDLYICIDSLDDVNLNYLMFWALTHQPPRSAAHSPQPTAHMDHAGVGGEEESSFKKTFQPRVGGSSAVIAFHATKFDLFLNSSGGMEEVSLAPTSPQSWTP